MNMRLKNMIFCNVSFHPRPNEYVLHQNKHIPQGKPALMNKFEMVKAFAEKNDGECRIVKEPHIKSDNLQMIIWFCCSCVANKEFDNAIAE